jgi:hypothetical protein
MSDLIAEFERELAHTDNVGATLTRFVTTCFEQRAEAGRASAYIIKLFGSSSVELRGYVRILDVTKELRHGSKMLALHMVHYWDTPRDDHKITRFADNLLCDAGEDLPVAPATFLVDLAEVLAIRRPDLALRLINRAANDPDAPADETLIDLVLPRIEAGKFLQTQTEGVRHFWQNHLRCAAAARALPTMTLRLGVEAVRGAMLPDEVFEVFRSSMTDDLWNGTIADLQPPAAEVISAPATEAKPLPVVIAGVRMVKPPASRPNRMLKPMLALAAMLVVLGVVMLRHQPKQATTTTLATVIAPTLPAPSQVVPPVPAKPQPSTKPVAITVSKSPSVATAPPKQVAVVVVPAPSSGPAPAAAAPASKPPAQTVVATVKAPVAPPNLALSKVTAPKSSAPKISNPIPAPKPPAPTVAAVPEEVVARPLAITAFDRWQMQETAALAASHPELLPMQQTMSLGAWKDTAAALEKLRTNPANQAKTRDLLRWLVIDPPISEEARKGVLLAWADLVPAEECLTLGVKLVDGGAVHAQQIRDAAWLVLVKQTNAWSQKQREQLRDLAAISERD